MRLHKPIGFFLLLWPTLWAVWLASHGKPQISTILIFVIGTFLTRSAGCIINDVADRNIDGFIERTKHRPLATNKIKLKNALFLFSFLISCAFLLVLLLNFLSVFVACFALLIMLIYPFLKRITHLPQLGLGVAFAFGVPMAFAAETNALPYSSWMVFLAASIWPVIYDTMYAMVDRDDDIKKGVKSTAILFGQYDKLIIATLQIILLSMLCMIGYLFHLKWIYFLSLLSVAVLFLYQQQLIKKRDRNHCFAAFNNNHWVGLLVFSGIVLSFLI